MSLAELYEAVVPPPKKCKVCDWYRQQLDEDKAFFDQRVRDNAAKMTRICADNLGLEADESTVRKHVRQCL